MAQVLDLQPRRLPRQARSRATVDAILEACARLLREEGPEGVTTRRLARRAGVGIGSLYEYFPNREAVLAALVQRRLGALVAEVRDALAEALVREPDEATGFLLRRIVAAVAADRDLFRMLLREAPYLLEPPQTRAAIAALFELGRLGGERAGRRVDLPHVEADTWLVGRMVAHAVLEIVFLESEGPDRELLVRELVRLTDRMVLGRDPGRPRRP